MNERTKVIERAADLRKLRQEVLNLPPEKQKPLIDAFNRKWSNYDTGIA
jgi:hypothetical protein